MNLKQRVVRLERTYGGTGTGKPCFTVEAKDGESGAEALARAFAERGLQREDLGYAVVVGRDVGVDEREFGSPVDGAAYWRRIVEGVRSHNEMKRGRCDPPSL